MRLSRLQVRKLFLGRSKDVSHEFIANDGEMAPGSGIADVASASVKYSVSKIGDIYTTRIFMDVTGCMGAGTAGDIIGGNAAANCHWGRITTAINGVIYGGTLDCFETPAGGNVDINVYSGDVSTGVENVAIGTGIVETLLVNSGNLTGGDATRGLAGTPTAGDYIYLTAGTATDVEFTAGELMLTLYGLAS